MLASGLGHKPAFSLQPHNFVCAYSSACANRRSSVCRFPSGRPGGYALRPALSVNPRTASALKPSNPHTPASSGAYITENLFNKVSKTLPCPFRQNRCRAPAKIWVLNAPARPVFLAYVRLKSNCTGVTLEPTRLALRSKARACMLPLGPAPSSIISRPVLVRT